MIRFPEKTMVLFLAGMTGWLSVGAQAARQTEPLVMKLEPGKTILGVRRHPVKQLAEGKESASPSLFVAPNGGLWTATVVREGDRERIWIQNSNRVDSDLGPAKPVTDGERAWHPRLAAAPDGKVWLTWCGRKTRGTGGNHSKQVLLRRIGPGRPGPVIGVSREAGRSCDPAIAAGTDGNVHIAWEESSKQPGEVHIAYRGFDPAGQALGPAMRVSQGSFDRRPAVIASGKSVHVAWDSLVSKYPTGEEDPDYDVFLRTLTNGKWGNIQVVDQRGGIQAAPDLAMAADGGTLVAYHSSHRHSLVKWWVLRRFDDGALWELTLDDKAALQEPSGEQQGAEFPAIAVLPDGRVVVASRPSQGAFLQLVDGKGISPVLDLTRKGWGARGMKMTLAADHNGSVCLARRARHHAVVDRFTVTKQAQAPLPWKKIQLQPKKSMPRLKSRRDTRQPFVSLPEGKRLFFGDPHMHSAASDGTGSQDEILARAWVRGLDFAALTDHDNIVGNRTFPSKYEGMAWITDVFNTKEGFTTLHAFEWTTPPVPKGYGHRNVYFRGSAPERMLGFKNGFDSTGKLFAELKKVKAIAIPHHTSWTGTDWGNAEEDVQRQFEVVSVHGASECEGNEPIPSREHMKGMFAVDGLKRGLKFGFVGGTDAHGLLWHHGIGRRRNPWTHGLTGVVADTNTREALFDGLYQRKTLATSGAFMRASLEVNGVTMGQEGSTTRPVEVRFAVQGSLHLESIEILRDGVEISRTEPDGPGYRGVFRDLEVTPGEHVYYLRAIQGRTRQDVDVVWTSPVFVSVGKKQ